jgi:PAS domain S-box-containing protein
VETAELLNAIQLEIDGLLGAVMHALPDGIVMVNSTGLIVFANKRLEEISGYRWKELIGRPIECLVPDDLSGTHEERRSHFLAEAGCRPMGTGLDIRLRRRDGTDIPVDIQLSSISVESSSYLLASVRDIRENKAVEGALRQSEERFRTLVEAAPVMIISVLPDGVIGSVNRAFESATGWRRDELVGNHFAPFVHPEDLSNALAFLGQACRGEPIEDHELRLLTTSGDNLIAEVTVVPLYSQGTVVEVLGAIHDVTEQRFMEEELRQSKERFRQAFKQGPLGLVLIDLDACITNVNHALCDFLGYARDELLDTAFDSLIHPDDQHTDMELARQLTSGTIPSYQVEQRYLTKDGSVVYGTVTTSMIRSELGAPLYSMRTLEDITQRKLLERELAAQATDAHAILLSLTPRESEVLEVMGETDTAAEMAARLFVSIRTVESHLAHAYRKLGVRTRVDAIDQFARMTNAVARFQPDVPAVDPTPNT